MNTKALYIYLTFIVSLLFLQSCAMNGMKGYQPSYGYAPTNGYEADSSYFGVNNRSPWYSVNAKKKNYGLFNSYSSRKAKKGSGGGYYGQSLSSKSSKSYHFANRGGPKTHKQRDVEWINNQNPNNYTIELAEDEKPSSVAKKLFNTPKQERMAQYKHQKGGKTVHTGIYGSFKDSESAKKALDKLPADVRKKAKVKQFGNAQQDASKPVAVHSGSTGSGSTPPVTLPTPPSSADD